MNNNIKYKIIEIIKQPRKNGGPRTVYKMLCTKCNKNFIYIRKSEINKRSLQCASCSHKKEPYKTLYNGLLNTCKHINRKIDITFEDYLNFIKNNKCHYCGIPIDFRMFSTNKGAFESRAYYLDRKDSSIDYLKDNLVVCCTRCNRAKSNQYSYEEWFGMTKYFRDKDIQYKKEPLTLWEEQSGL